MNKDACTRDRYNIYVCVCVCILKFDFECTHQNMICWNAESNLWFSTFMWLYNKITIILKITMLIVWLRWFFLLFIRSGVLFFNWKIRVYLIET